MVDFICLVTSCDAVHSENISFMSSVGKPWSTEDLVQTVINCNCLTCKRLYTVSTKILLIQIAHQKYPDSPKKKRKKNCVYIGSALSYPS